MKLGVVFGGLVGLKDEEKDRKLSGHQGFQGQSLAGVIVASWLLQLFILLHKSVDTQTVRLVF